MQCNNGLDLNVMERPLVRRLHISLSNLPHHSTREVFYISTLSPPWHYYTNDETPRGESPSEKLVSFHRRFRSFSLNF